MSDEIKAQAVKIKISKLSIFLTVFALWFGVMGLFVFDDFSSTWLAGLLGGGTVLSAIIGFAAYRLSGRKSKPANLSYCLTLLLFGWIVATAAAMHYKQTAKHLAPLERNEALYSDTDTGTRQEDNLELLERSMTGEDVSEELADLNREQVAAMQAKAEDVGDVEGKVLLVLAAMKQRMGELTNARLSALNAFVETGGINPNGLKNSEEVTERLRMLHEFDDSVKTQIKMASEMEQQLTKDLETSGVPETFIESTVHGFRSAMMQDLMIEFLNNQAQLIQAYHEIIMLYSDNPEEWWIDPDTGVLNIRDEAVYEARADIFDRIEKLGEQEQDIQRRIVERAED